MDGGELGMKGHLKEARGVVFSKCSVDVDVG
jgi:hypothetical protein